VGERFQREGSGVLIIGILCEITHLRVELAEDGGDVVHLLGLQTFQVLRFHVASDGRSLRVPLSPLG